MPAVIQPFCETCGEWLFSTTWEDHVEANNTHVVSEKFRYIDAEDIIPASGAYSPPSPEGVAVAGTAPVPGGGQKEMSYIVNWSGTLSTSFEAVMRARFPGTDLVGLPKSIKAVVKPSKDNSPYVIKVVDISNGSNTVASRTITTDDSNDYDVFDLGTLSSVPSGWAIFEFQVRRTSSPSFDLRVDSFTLSFIEDAEF
jgi:hypothetical protein